jgi:hypothetical protein
MQAREPLYGIGLFAGRAGGPAGLSAVEFRVYGA